MSTTRLAGLLEMIGLSEEIQVDQPDGAAYVLSVLAETVVNSEDMPLSPEARELLAKLAAYPDGQS